MNKIAKIPPKSLKFILLGAGLAILILVAGIYFWFGGSFLGQVKAGTSDNVSGFAWGDTIGWVSFNCTDTNSCFETLYTSQNLGGHSVSAECNPGGGTSCPCSETEDVSINPLVGYGEVTANPRKVNTWVNAIGNRKFVENLPNAQPIRLDTYRYKVSSRLPVLPVPDPNQQQNPQVVHMMIQLWDGREALWDSNQKTLEAVIYWDLNPWTADYGKIKVYTNPPYTLVDTGITLTPDTNWHNFEIVADFLNKKYISITVDGQTKYLSNVALISVSQPTWDITEVALILTTESEPAWPGGPTCPSIFYWTQQFRDLEFSRGADYGVNINQLTGEFSGYGWSENIGWISFNRSDTGAPPGPPYNGAETFTARFNFLTKEVSGWARALSYGGGWDGWIKLRKDPADGGTAYGLIINGTTKEFEGWAWGSDVVGWVSFNYKNCDIDGNGFIDSGACGGDNATTPISDYKVNTTLSFNADPSAANLLAQANSLGYCNQLDPAHYFKWAFFDLEDGTSQTAYQLQIANDSGFSSLQFDSGYTVNPSQERFVSVKQTPSLNELGYNSTYYWRIQVFDSQGATSDWVYYQDNLGLPEPFTTALHAYPDTDFDWSPQSPAKNETVNFDSEDPPNETTFYVVNPANRSWLWSMPPGLVEGTDYQYVDATNASSQNPKVKFQSFGNGQVTLQATDLEIPASCSKTKTIIPSKPLPKWREIVPWF